MSRCCVLIACLSASCAAIRNFIYEPHFRNLQFLIQPDVLDISDALRTMNPYVPLYQLNEDPEESEHLQKAMYSRMDQLWPIGDEPILFIETIYVLEDYRQKGLCRLMIDMLNHLFGPCTLWLNMEPTAGEELTSFTPYSPLYSHSELGHLSLNASIAERLGFTIDPRCWRGQAELSDEAGQISYQPISYRKCAYRLSEHLQSIVKEDGDLVSVGRAMEQLSDPPEGNQAKDAFTDLRTRKSTDLNIAELRVAEHGDVMYSFLHPIQNRSLLFWCITPQPSCLWL